MNLFMMRKIRSRPEGFITHITREMEFVVMSSFVLRKHGL